MTSRRRRLIISAALATTLFPTISVLGSDGDMWFLPDKNKLEVRCPHYVNDVRGTLKREYVGVFFLALAAGMAMASLAGLMVGTPSLRLRGDYLAIVTLGFGEIIRVVIENTRLLGQATGISGLPASTSVVWAGMGVVATVVMARRVLLSTQGRALLAIREDEVAAEAMGVDTVGYKVRASVISAAFAGLAGGLLVHQILLCTPRMFTFVKSFEVVAMVVLGGMGSITGSVLAAFVLTAAPEALRAADSSTAW